MDEKDLLDLIFSLRADVWQNWGFIITVNLAVWGWLIQRHGLYSFSEKFISTIGYSLFIVIILIGMDKAYKELDSAANELAYKYVKNKKIIVEGGIIESFISKSPQYCQEVKTKKSSIQCRQYSFNFNFVLFGNLVGWIFTMGLFWYEPMWDNSRLANQLKT